MAQSPCGGKTCDGCAIDIDIYPRIFRNAYYASLVLERLHQHSLPERMLGAVELQHRLERPMPRGREGQ